MEEFDVNQILNLVADDYIIEAMPVSKKYYQYLKKNRKGKIIKILGKTGSVAAAVFFLVIWFGVTYPVAARNLPIVGGVFRYLQGRLMTGGDYGSYATGIGVAQKCNGISITLSEVYCDGKNLFVSYAVENENGFKGYQGDKYFIPQMEYDASYYMIIGEKAKKLDEFGVAGLEGEFVDDNTFMGIESFPLFDGEYPDEFEIDVTIRSLSLYNEKNAFPYRVNGNWKFRVPVTVNQEGVKVYQINESRNGYSIDSVIVSPVMLTVYTSYPEGCADKVAECIYNSGSTERLPVMGQNNRTNGVTMIPIKDVGKEIEIYIINNAELVKLNVERDKKEVIEKYAVVSKKVNLQ